MEYLVEKEKNMVFHYLDAMANLSSRPPGSKRWNLFKELWIRWASDWGFTIFTDKTKDKEFGYETKLKIRIYNRPLNESRTFSDASVKKQQMSSSEIF